MSLLIVFLDVIAVAGCLAGFVFLIRGWKKTFRRSVKFLQMALLGLSLLYYVLLAFQWSGLAYTSERSEDMAGALLPMLWAFVFYMMIQELTKKDILESRERYHTLVENVNVGITLVDADHRIVMANSAMSKLFDIDADKLIGCNCYQQFENRVEICPHCPGEKAMSSGKPEVAESQAIRKDGSHFLAKIQAFPLLTPDGQSAGFIEVVEDITEQRKTERAMRSIVEASSTTTGPDFFESLVKAIAHALEFKYAFIGKFINQEQRVIKTLAVWADNRFADNFEYDLKGTPCENIIFQNKWFFGNNVQESFPDDQILKDFNVNSYFGVPLHDSGGNVLGLLSVMNDEPTEDGGIPRMNTILSIFASRVSSEMERLNKEQEIINIAKFPEENPNPVMRISRNGEISYHNMAALDIIDPSICPEADQGLDFLKRNASEILSTGVTMRLEFETCGKVYALTFAPIAQLDYVNIYGLDITIRKLASEALRKTEEKFRGLVESSSDWIWEIDENGVYTYSSPQSEKILGYKPEELIGKTPFDLMEPEERKRIERIHYQLQSKAEPIINIVNTNLHKTGRKVIIETSGVPILDRHGNVTGYRGVDRDITDRKEAEDELQRTTSMLQMVLGNIPQFVFWKNRDSVYMGCNENFAHAAGFESPEEIVGKSDYDMAWDKEQADFFREVDERVMSLGQGEYHIIEPQQQADGKEAWLDTNKVPLFDSQGKVIGILGTYEDITERIKDEQKLRESENKYRKLIESAPDAIFVADAQSGIIIDANKSAEKLIGISHDEIVGLHQTQIHPQEDTEKYKEFFASDIEKGTASIQKDAYVCHKDGHAIPVEINSTVTEVGGKKIIQGIFRDITERKQNEQMLKEREEYLRSIFRAAPTGIGVVVNRTFTQVNDQMCTMTGYTSEELLGKNARMVYPSNEEYERVGRVKYSQIQKEGTGTIETRFKRKDGKIIDVIVSSTPLDTKDMSKGVTFTALDISRRKEVERERQKLNKELAEKNKELESILYAASHDLKSPLVNLQGFSYQLAQSSKYISDVLATKAISEEELEVVLNKDIPDAVNFIKTSTEKMDSLLSGLLDISRLNQMPVDVEHINMNSLMADVRENLQYQILKKEAKVEIEPLPDCMGNVSEINRVFTNLLDNALKYLDPDRPGKITITGKTEDQQSIYCVEDNGIGIKEDYKDKIFDIFYQLRPERKQGEGIGLTIVRRIVEKHNGLVWVESQEGKGSKFFVSMPNK